MISLPREVTGPAGRVDSGAGRSGYKLSLPRIRAKGKAARARDRRLRASGRAAATESWPRQPIRVILARMALSRRGFLLAAGAGALAAPGIAGLVAGRRGVEAGAERPESLWTSEIPPIPPAPRLEGEHGVDLAIVGGGYTGLACAFYAKKLRPDWSVSVLESHRLGSGASSRNSGAVRATYLGVRSNGVAKRGLERLVRFIEEEEIECDLRRVPVIELYSSKLVLRKASASLEPGSRLVPVDELSETMRTDFYAGAVERSHYSSLHPAKLVAGHVRAARRMGVELHEYSPVLEVRRGRPAELLTPLGRMRAKHVFLATNAHTPRLGFLASSMMPVHQYTLATRRLTQKEMQTFGLERWSLRFERRLLPVTTHLTPSGHLFVRIVLGYASFDSCEWRDLEGARELASRIFEQRYPWVADVAFEQGWHGVTGHTLNLREIACPIAGDNIHVSAAYNGLGVMPGHNNGYLTACRIAEHHDDDVRHLTDRPGGWPLPGEFYRSLVFKPFMKLLSPG
jgi:glycine/D-amino acid oxidase-like deaminating enzyme